MDFRTFAPTQTQLRMLEMAGRTGNLSAVFRLEGAVDEARLEAAVARVVRACPPFAYRYLSVGDQLTILLSPEETTGWSTLDAAGADEAHLHDLIRGLTGRAFRMDGGPPFVFCLVRARGCRYLVFACHPALIDRFSLKPLFAAISGVYAGGEPPAGLALAQDELLAAQQRQLTGPVHAESVRFWLELVRDTSFEWHPARVESDLSGDASAAVFPADATRGLVLLARRLGVPAGDLLTAAFHLFLSRLARTDTVLTTHAHRIGGAPDARIGFNENKPAHKSVLDPDLPLARFLRQSARLFARTRHHSDIPAREIARELTRREPDYKRISNVSFTADTLPAGELSLSGVRATLLPRFSHRLDAEDVSITFDLRDELTFQLVTRSAQEMSGLSMAFPHFLALLKALPAQLDRRLAQVDLFHENLTRRARELAEGAALTAPAEDPLQLFFRAAQQQPGDPALRFRDRSLTYGALDCDALAIAGGLASALAGHAEPLVAIAMDRSERPVQAMLGVMAAGAGYLPLDPAMPAERLAFILADAKPAAVIVDAASRAAVTPLAPCPVLLFEDLVQAAPADACAFVPPQRVAYVIYTSGTTGRPKGVVVERGNLAHLLAALAGVWGRGPGTRWLQFASLAFDASVLGIFNPLCHGAELVLAPPEVRTDPEALFELLAGARITHADLPPALLPLLPRRPLPDLAVIFCGGEALDEDAVRFWSKAVRLDNCYGPTEATVMCTVNTMGGSKAGTHLGRPLPGYRTALIDESGGPALLGGVGEIAIGGPAVARGYLGRPELTAQKFVTDPDGGRRYRTGDLARFLPNGDLEFLGRADFQVKIRGFRIELGDIETAISEQPEVKSVTVGVLTREGNRALAAWYVGRGLAPQALRERLAARLPHYMVPSFLIPLDAFPLTANGKVDRARLPPPAVQDANAGPAPFDELELFVQEVWAAVLKVPAAAIGPDANFFHLGGHSLAAAVACNRINARLSGEVRPRALFEYPVFSDFSERVRSAPRERAALPPLGATGATSAPLRNRLIELIHSRAVSRPDDNTYNVVSLLHASPQVDVDTLAAALGNLLSAHPIFAAAFREEEGRLSVEAPHIPAAVVPVRTLAEGARDAAAKRAEEYRREPLGIGTPPLWRAEVFTAPDEGPVLALAIHHALFDGWSLNLFMEELAARYQAQTEGHSYGGRRLTWFDYCLWAKDLPKSRPFLDSLAYWRRKLAGAEARVELPVDASRKRPDANEAVQVRFEPATVSALKALADQHGLTLPPLVFSLYLTWLWRIAGQEELVVGYPYAGRDVPGTEDIYGTFVTMGFLRQTVDPAQPFAELARAVHRQMIDDRENLVAAPYDAEIASVDSLNVIFSLQTGISLEGRLGPGTFTAEELPSRTSKADLAGIFYLTADGAIEGRIEYDGSLFTAATMNGFVRTFRTLVQSAAARPADRVEELAYQTADERARFLELSTGPALSRSPMSIPARFAEVVRDHGERPALHFHDRTLTFTQLDRASDAVAGTLSTRVSTGDFVGLGTARSDSAVISMLAILKIGCTYVPLDPSYPADRLRWFATNCGVKVVMADPDSARALTEAGLTGVEFLTDEPATAVAASPVSPDAIAYVIHTSGSTGQPKGVMIEHHSVVRMIAGSVGPMLYEPGAVSTVFASFSFDTSVLELFLPLLTGGLLVVVPEEIRRDPAALHAFLRDQGVTHAVLPPVMLQGFPREPLPALKFLGFGGDTIDEGTAEFWSQHTRLFSLYGPTEITVQASAGEIVPGANPRTIGRPLPGYRVYLLNRRRQPVPEGAVGEIVVGGENLARGYLNREDLTAERFVIDPFGDSPYAAMYLTGDLGRRAPDGTIDFFGRNDGQLKLRGFRIELGEIENRLSTFPGLTHVACAAQGAGDAKVLVAYYVAERDLTADELRAHVTGFLPDYMIPSFFVRLPRLPASPNGKLDRKALPALATRPVENPPRAGLEVRIAEVWEALLAYRGIGRDESFFQIGGNSLLAVRLQAELKRRLSIEISITEFYGAPTIAALAAGRVGASIPLAIEEAAAPLPAPPAPPLPRADGPPHTVLLTGATGFLGIHLLAELARRVDSVQCLVRAPDAAQGLAAITAAAERAGLTLDESRITVIPGDLAAPGLGLQPEVRAALAAHVDAVVHCGAFVHHLHAYRTMRAANVDGTRALLELALTDRLKRFCFVSTLTAAFAIEGATHAREEIVSAPPVAESGYLLTKWVGEQLVARTAAEYGLPAVIARPGNITGATGTGYTNFANNHFWLFVKGCLQLGMFPDLAPHVEMLPVDTVARAIGALVTGHDSGLLVANLSNPITLTPRKFFARLASLGHAAEPRPAAEWQQALAGASEDNALAKIRDLYAGDLSAPHRPVEQARTLAALEAGQTALATGYGEILPLYLKYLEREGFLV